MILPVATARRTGAWLWAELRVRKGEGLVALVVGLVAAASSIVPVYTLGYLVDQVRAGGSTDVIVGVSVVVLVAAVISGCAMGLSLILIARLCGRILADLREQVVDRALTLPTPVLERAGRGDLLSRVGADVSAIGSAVTQTVPNMVWSVLLGTLSLVAMVGIDWRLGLAGALAVPAYTVALRWYLPRSAPGYRAERESVAERGQLLVDSAQGLRTVHAYRLEQKHLADIDRASGNARDVLINLFDLFTRLVGRVNRAEFVGLSAILIAGFFLVDAGAVTVGETSAAAVLFHRLFNPIGMLLFSFDDIQAGGASLARLVGVVDMEPGVVPAEGAAPADASLVLSDVDFSYDGAAQVLFGVGLRIEPGERVALVGSTGAGKSTLALIAAGSLQPTHGVASVGGVPVGSVANLREHVAVVSQETHVFSGTLLEDLQLARAGASREDASSALERVGALGWVAALESGLDTAVGEGGHELTPAQAQQLALARLVLLDPAIAILDEATAEAGSAGARDLEESAAAATAGRTTLVVAHRLTQAASADRIVVLERGRIVEQGAHASLVAAGGRYAQLWSAWEGRTPTQAPATR
ncbi:ABC transporter ATP-binding protein [Cryptosporangium sp. NPDC048952]|uniref:ABC transporter ATP-binding protein n=1 Tax=Cryptosporangium sp. NPDC048952 TaxID=3363961 RepID=UPI0037238CF1